ncbi:Na(+)/H(+) antiporter NhaP [Porphyridium purpureum]|uniref:Na(+)/H(+) antiporter NhaP n=1 Tax=Porphyridium purpureum TaxID=35688 RepID=A0A5J4Z3J0_PORPP|nr:Na(+)/H(+) antiporter NhaP [Porphyridium purpureum]|eukprot:POR4130..scf295_1
MNYMGIFEMVTMLLTVTVTVRCINWHYIRLPASVMMALSAIIASLLLLVLARLQVPWPAYSTVAEIRIFLTNGFPDILMRFLLGYLLFASAIEVDLRALRRVTATAVALGLISTLVSTLLIGLLTYCLLRAVSPLPMTYCLLFGAIVSPTDPVAVASILNDKPDLIPVSTRYFVMSEALFNDAVGIVLFSGLLQIVTYSEMSWTDHAFAIASLFLQECLGGVLLGLFLGYLAYLLIQSVEEAVLEITISVVLVANIQVLCNLMGVSAPLASVVAGLLMGNHGVAYSFSTDGRNGFYQLWRFIDETLNSLLFFAIGLMTVAMDRADSDLAGISILQIAYAAVGIIPISLFSRAISVACSLLSVVAIEKTIGRRLRHPKSQYKIGTILLLTWAGLRGGLAIALTLLVGSQFLEARQSALLFIMTYSLVVWSVIGQGIFFETACTLIQEASFMLYQPLLGETATGSKSFMGRDNGERSADRKRFITDMARSANLIYSDQADENMRGIAYQDSDDEGENEKGDPHDMGHWDSSSSMIFTRGEQLAPMPRLDEMMSLIGNTFAKSRVSQVPRNPQTSAAAEAGSEITPASAPACVEGFLLSEAKR